MIIDLRGERFASTRAGKYAMLMVGEVKSMKCSLTSSSTTALACFGLSG